MSARPPRSPERWVLEALLVGAALLLAGIAGGATLGRTSSVTASLYAGLVIFLVGGVMAAARIGVAGIGAALLAFMTSLGTGLEARHFDLSRHAPVSIESLAQWSVTEHGFVVRRAVQPLSAFAAWQAAPKRVSQEAVPLVESADGAVVAFTCVNLGRKVQAGSVVVDLQRFDDGVDPACLGAVQQSRQKLGAHAIAPGAEARLVRVFANDEAWRHAGDFDAVLGIGLGGFLVYALVVVGFRRRLG